MTECDSHRYGDAAHQCECRPYCKGACEQDDRPWQASRTGHTEEAGGEEGENTVHYAAPATCARGFGAAAAGTCEEKRTLTATAQAAEPDSEYEWHQVAQRFVVFLYPHWHLAPSGLTSALCSCGRDVLQPHGAPLGRE